MANPLPYFKLDTTFDRRTETLIRLHGNDLLVVLIRAWQQVYYHAKAELDLSSPILVTALAMDCQLSEERLRQMIEVLVETGIFEGAGWKQGKLTSNGIRTRTDEALERRKADAERKRKKREERMERSRVPRESTRTPHEEKRKEKKSKEEKRRTPQNSGLIRKGEVRDAAETIAQVADKSVVSAIVKGLKQAKGERPLTPEEIEQERERQIEALRRSAELSDASS